MRFFTSVDHLMLSQRTALAEASRTHVAFVRLLARVNSRVSGQSFGLGEASFAHAASMRFLASVQQFVLGQAFRCATGFITDIA